MSLVKYYQAVNPKVRGTQNLHNYFLASSVDLDFFVMLSSIAGIMGNAGQSNYAAGNTFQDALAHDRATLKLPALAIDVGSVVDAGWVLQNRDVVSSTVLGFAKNIYVRDLTELMVYQVCDPNALPQITIGLQDYPIWDARFGHMDGVLAGSSHRQESQDQTQSLQSQIAAANQDAVQIEAVVLEAFRRKLGYLLSLSMENVQTEDSIAGHGVDSLVAVEIRNWWRKEAGVEVTVFEILNGKKSVRQVVEGIVKEMMS